MALRIICLSVLVESSDALRALTGATVHRSALHGVAEAKAVALAALCSASLICAPTSAAAATLNEAIIDVSESSYPIIQALKPETFGPFSEKLAKLVLDIKKEKLGPAIDAGLDVFASVPADKRDAFKSLVKESFADLKTDSCTLVPLPPASIGDKFKAIASETVDSAKLKAFDDAWSPTLSALSKTDSAICLPSVETLDKLALAQADLGRSFGAAESKKFAAVATPPLKSTLSISKVLPLLDDAKKLAPSATAAQKSAFQAAGKKVEYASKQEALKVKMAALKEAQANKPDGAAARQAAIDELAAKKAADLEARAKKSAELKAAQENYYTELRAKADAAKAAGK